ncbi:MAG: hypothetical protein IPI98_00355 [Chitinophagaceae bacterium]|nr:hypothetical protein [Chitinophagaceae bacterium]
MKQRKRSTNKFTPGKNKQLKWWYFSIFLLLALTSSLVWLRSYKRKINEEKILNYFATSLYNQNTVEDVFWDISKNCISRLNFEDCVVYSYDEAEKCWCKNRLLGTKPFRPLYSPGH